MPTFDDSEQEIRLAELREREEEDLAQILSKKYGVSYIDLTMVSVNNNALGLIKEEEARRLEVAAFNKVGKVLSLAVRAPQKPEIKQLINRFTERGMKVEIYMVSTKSLMRAWDRYKEISSATRSEAGVLDISGTEIEIAIGKIHSIPDIQTSLNTVLKEKGTHKVSKLIETIVAGAMSLRASDIHVEPEELDVRIRYRIDGVLTEITLLDRATYELLLSRVKLLSGLKLNVKNTAQDGRFSITIGENNVETRSSVLPGAYGESIVLRLLDPRTIAVPLHELGIEPKLLALLQHEIKKPNGMLLNTGPTGSGKTTTLYAFLRKIHTPEIKIVTIEDPVEYHLPGIVQTQVDKKNYTFASGLRSTLRQDPDVIMVGEIRDEEVASTAINAALTGHLVFSTLHTNTAAGTFPRLIDLGVDPQVIGSAISAVMAQRLVRKLHPEKKKEVSLAGEDLKAVNKILDSIVDKSLIPENRTVVWEPLDESDSGTHSYLGRIGIFEAIIVDAEIERLIKTNPSEREIQKAALAQGNLTLKQDGIIKVLRGITSLSELRRVIDLEADDAMVEGVQNPVDEPLNNTFSRS